MYDCGHVYMFERICMRGGVYVYICIYIHIYVCVNIYI